MNKNPKEQTKSDGKFTRMNYHGHILATGGEMAQDIFSSQLPVVCGCFLL